jgi:hypothetical protein
MSSSSDHAKRLIPARGVAQRYSVHIGSLCRWVNKGTLPRPDAVINRRNYWLESTLDRTDRERTKAAARGQPAKSTSTPKRENQEPESAA